MEQTRIAELLRPFLSTGLSDQQLNNISMYIDILLKWNQKMNLTAVRQPEEIVTRHFGESLFAAQHLFPAIAHVGTGGLTRPAERSSAPSFDSAQALSEPTPSEKGCPTRPLQRRVGMSPGRDVASNVSTVVDVGSGAGFPGLPIKIWAPDIRLTLIESNHKKATFLKEVARTLGFRGVEVFTGRAETFPAAAADIVTLRAVEKFEKILPIAAGLVRPGGRLVLLIGSSQIDQAKTVVGDVEWQPATPLPLSSTRTLLLGYR
jgi:16S rRNA (guanine527-N7)-methyltransferase